MMTCNTPTPWWERLAFWTMYLAFMGLLVLAMIGVKQSWPQ